MISRNQSLSEDEHAWKLCVSPRGEVWYLIGCGDPMPSGKPIGEFLKTCPVPDDVTVRITGNLRDAPLIAQAYLLQIQGRLRRLELCTPQICANKQEADDPRVLLWYMRYKADGLPPSLGGWHAMVQAEYPSYALAAAFAARRGQPSRQFVESLVVAHPAHRALAFVPRLDMYFAGALLGVIRDPRWFIDPDNPERVSFLRQYLGLHPRVMREVLERKGAFDVHRRCATALRAWHSEAVPVLDSLTPGDFLARVYYRVLSRTNYTQATLRTTQRLLDFVRHTWLDALYDNSVTRDPLFVPEIFFFHQDDIAAYRSHVAAA